jgi:hypothetical protein
MRSQNPFSADNCKEICTMQTHTRRSSRQDIPKVTPTQALINDFESEMRQGYGRSFIGTIEHSRSCAHLTDAGSTALSEIAAHIKQRYPTDRDKKMREAWWILLGKMQFKHRELPKMPKRDCSFVSLAKWARENATSKSHKTEAL